MAEMPMTSGPEEKSHKANTAGELVSGGHVM